MDAIYIILFAIILTLVLTLAMPRLSQASPALRRFLWITVIVGVIALIAVITIAFLI